jgi:small-conductance mechanosensitive channel
MPQFFRALFNVIFVVFFVQRLANAILRPSGPEWRLVSVHTRAATLLVYIVTALAVIVSADFLLGVIGNIESSSLGLTVGKSLLAAFLTGSLLIAAATLKPFSAEDGTPRHWPTLLRVALYALGVFPIAAALLGYVGLAQYVSQQVVINGALIITLYVGFLTARAVGAEGAFAQTRIGQSIGRRFGLAEQTVDQMGMIAGIAINVVAVAVIVPLILLQIGFQTADLKSWLYGVVSEIKIGSISISLIGVVTGMIVFIAGYFLTRWFQSWLDSTVMARGKVEPGVRNSIRTAVGYAGIALAALFGISAAGINLSNLALVAGALSLGIGFGLQNVVSNFVSGLILLAERPFKVGDWIEAGTVSGTVKRINVRATEIETFQRQTIIMPNSELINAAVGNWTHRNKLARGDIRIGVAYGTDPKMVRAILLEIAHTHPRVLKNPEPFVIFANFGESSLDFELRFFLSDVSLRQEVATELRFAIVEAFEAKGIEIPFPQRDLNITSSSISALAKALAKEETGEPKPLKRQTKKPSVVEKAPVKSRSGRRYRELD